MATIADFADAIAYAEGFYSSGSRPQRNNNPGDLTVDITGTGVGTDGPFVVYGTAADGWAALRLQVAKMLDGSSAFYSPDMSILEVAQRYTATEPGLWAANVASRLGVSIHATLGDVLTVGASIGIGAALMLLLVAFLASRRRF